MGILGVAGWLGDVEDCVLAGELSRDLPNEEYQLAAPRARGWGKRRGKTFFLTHLWSATGTDTPSA